MHSNEEKKKGGGGHINLLIAAINKIVCLVRPDINLYNCKDVEAEGGKVELIKLIWSVWWFIYSSLRNEQIMTSSEANFC